MIPKIIHYCWFGGNELSELAERCIESWKRYCPDYKIIEWNESNFDLDCSDFVKEAYQAKKWAFVSDYARLKIIYDHGGIYLDTDVEVIKPLFSYIYLQILYKFNFVYYFSNFIIFIILLFLQNLLRLYLITQQRLFLVLMLVHFYLHNLLLLVTLCDLYLLILLIV